MLANNQLRNFVNQKVTIQTIKSRNTKKTVPVSF